MLDLDSRCEPWRGRALLRDKTVELAGPSTGKPCRGSFPWDDCAHGSTSPRSGATTTYDMTMRSLGSFMKCDPGAAKSAAADTLRSRGELMSGSGLRITCTTRRPQVHLIGLRDPSQLVTGPANRLVQPRSSEPCRTAGL